MNQDAEPIHTGRFVNKQFNVTMYVSSDAAGFKVRVFKGVSHYRTIKADHSKWKDFIGLTRIYNMEFKPHVKH